MLPFKFIALKQNNDGLSFIVSECKLSNFDPLHKYEEITQLKQLSQEEMFSLFEKSYYLSHKLFNKYSMCQCSNCIINEKHINEKLDKKENNNKENNNLVNRIDLNEYERV